MNYISILRKSGLIATSLFLIFGFYRAATSQSQDSFSGKAWIQKVRVIKPENRRYTGPITKVNIKVKNNKTDPKGKVLEVTFNKHQLTLKPADPRGERGTTYFQVKPGKYVIQWKVKNHKFLWPRAISFRRILIVQPEDKWIHIEIDGSKIQISQ